MRAIWSIVTVLLFSCSQKSAENTLIEGTWELQKGVVIKNNDTIVTDYTRDVRFLKIINKNHFAFLKHDLKKGKDSSAVFVAGGGAYEFDGKYYKEQLEFCSGRDWEGKNFIFQLEIKGDTLVQSGIERIEALGIDQKIEETYLKIN